MTITMIAYLLQWYPDPIQVTRSGRIKADAPRARRALTELIRQGRVVALGKERTLHAGDRPVMTYGTPDFAAWLTKLRERDV